MRFKLFLLLLLIPILLLGKKSPEQNATGLPYIYWRLIPLEFNIDKKIPNPENDKLLIDFLSKELLDLKDGENLKPIAKRSNKHSHHFLFQQMLKGSPVYEAYFKVNYLHSGEILSLSNGFFNIPQNLSSSQTHPNALDKTAILDKWLSQNPFNREQVVESEAIWLYLEDDLKAVLKVFIDIPEQV